LRPANDPPIPKTATLSFTAEGVTAPKRRLKAVRAYIEQGCLVQAPAI
jgi:hypothetical protein